MKDSGIEWIGEIPDDWKVGKIKWMSDIYTGNSIPTEIKDIYNDSVDAVPYIATKDISLRSNHIDYENGIFIKNQDNSFKRAPANSTLLCIEGGSAGRKISFTNQEVAFVNKLCCFKPDGENPKYIYYYLQSPAFKSEFDLNISGLIGGVSIGLLKNHSITIPPNKEQQKIANFLDQKVSEIDHILEKTRESIEEYKKYKQSIITEAVTKGLNPDVEMKDSGIELIGEIPKHWKAAKTKHVTSKITDGAHVSPDTNNGKYDFISTVNIKSDKIDFYDCLKTSEDSYLQLVNNGCKPLVGDVLISKDGTVGKTVVIDFEKDFVVASSLVIMRSLDIINPFYLNYVLKSYFVQEQLNTLMKGTGLKRVSVANNGNLLITIPSKDEQVDIICYLNNKCNEIDSLISQKETLLKDLELYKKSLIYECVTGKREV